MPRGAVGQVYSQSIRHANCIPFIRSVDLPGKHVLSLPKIRRQRVFQVVPVPGAEQLQKLLSIGP